MAARDRAREEGEEIADARPNADRDNAVISIGRMLLRAGFDPESHADMERLAALLRELDDTRAQREKWRGRRMQMAAAFLSAFAVTAAAGMLQWFLRWFPAHWTWPPHGGGHGD